MNTAQKKGMACAILIMAVGVCWLLNIAEILPGVNWLWTGSLGVIGLLMLGFGGINYFPFSLGTSHPTLRGLFR